MDNLNEDIYNKYFNIVYKYVLKLVRNVDIAEEITQETFFRAIKNINRFKYNCSLTTWFCTIAKNIYYTEYQKNKKVVSIHDINFEKIETEKDIEEFLIDKEEREKLYSRIKKLDITTQNVILLRITEEMPFKEIGLLFNKSENWAKVTFDRGKIKLRKD